MPRPAIWALALVGSVVVHGLGAAAYLATRSLDPPPRQSGPQSRLALDTVTAPTETARAAQPDADSAALSAPDAAGLAAGAIPTSSATPLPPPVARAEPSEPVSNSVQSEQAAGQSVASVAPGAARSQSLVPVAAEIGALNPASPSVAAESPPTSRAETVSTPGTMVASSQVSGTRVAATASVGAALNAVAQDAALVPAAPAPITNVPDIEPSAIAVAAALPLAQQGLPQSPDAEIAAQASNQSTQVVSVPASGENAATTDTAKVSTAAASEPLPTETGTATLAWAFGDRLVTDPKSLQAIQVFMAPDALPGADQVRDDLSSVLTGVPCARMSATFLPEDGVLEMRGHIPDPALQSQVLDALQAQVGDGIPVRANLLHLPAPQCQALTGIADVGLPQSTDQFIDARLIGATAHAREYSYTEGQRLQFDLTAPDYDAYVYVDYFNAAGEVIHLVPNDTIALERSPATSLFGIGQDRADKPSLRITIGPPFGQEIAVAFAASEPLYEGLRPIVEPADAYLEWLKTRVAEARAANPAFKGEWVYFFITTSAASQ